MSYCVNCGVELHETASRCPLCKTNVNNPNKPVDTQSPTPFPTKETVVEPVSQKEAATLICLNTLISFKVKIIIFFTRTTLFVEIIITLTNI